VKIFTGRRLAQTLVTIKKLTLPRGETCPVNLKLHPFDEKDKTVGTKINSLQKSHFV
jgi:hypothetical protein